MNGGDAKRPQYITYFKHKAPQDDSDFFQLISMLFGIASFLFKVSKYDKLFNVYRLNGEYG